MDLIEREAALNVFKTLPPYEGERGTDYIHNIIEAYVRIAMLPTADVVTHGRWIDVEPAPHNLFYATCSVCGDRQTIEVANYCPMCGASMDEVEE